MNTTQLGNTVTDNTIEQDVQAKGKTAPRVTPADVEANIASEHFFTADDGCVGAFVNKQLVTRGRVFPDEIGHPVVNPLGLLTFCVLVLQNGFTVTGKSACASPDNFDADIGRKIARSNAVLKVWSFMGHQLKQELHLAEKRYIA